MADKPRSKVKADIKKNRLYITLSVASKKELEKVYTDIRFCVADLKPGFDIVTDLSNCSIGHLNGIPTLRKIMDYLVINQPGEVVRVVGKMSVIFKQLIRLTTRFQGYRPSYVATMEEAEEILSQSTKRDGLRFHLLRQQVEYTVNQEVEKGYLVDISISGCAIQGPTLPLAAEKEITIAIGLHQAHDDLVSFSLAAKVIRVQEDLFAAQFLDLDDARKAQLYTCLAFEARREILPE